MINRYEAAQRYSSEKVAFKYDEERFSSAGGRRFHEIEMIIVMSNLPNQRLSSILALDVAAGTGRFAIELAKNGVEVTACDISYPMTRVMKSKTKMSSVKNLQILLSDAYHLPMPSNTFNYVVCMRLLNQIAGIANKADIIRELCRVCKQGGVVVFDIVNSASLARFASSADPIKLVSIKEILHILNSIPNISLSDVIGGLIVTQTLIEHLPRYLSNFVTKFDGLLRLALNNYATRVYFVVRKDMHNNKARIKVS